MNLKRSNSKFNNYSLMKIFSYYKKYLLSTLLLMYFLVLSLLMVTTSNAQKFINEISENRNLKHAEQAVMAKMAESMAG